MGAASRSLPSSSPSLAHFGTSFPRRPAQGLICCPLNGPLGNHLSKLKFISAGSLTLSSCPFWYWVSSPVSLPQHARV